MSNKVLLGDVVEKLSGLTDESVDLVVTSPPYWTAVSYETDTIQPMTYNQYIDWLGSVWQICFLKLRSNGKLVINTPILPIPTKIIKQSPRHLMICPQKVVQLNVSLRHGCLPSHKRPAELIGIAQAGAVA